MSMSTKRSAVPGDGGTGWVAADEYSDHAMLEDDEETDEVEDEETDEVEDEETLGATVSVVVAELEVDKLGIEMLDAVEVVGQPADSTGWSSD